AAAENYLGAIKASLENKNMVLDMRIPLTKRYQQDVLDTAVSQYLAKELDAAGTEQAIADGWNAITNEAGKDAQLAAYVASLGVKRELRHHRPREPDRRRSGSRNPRTAPSDDLGGRDGFRRRGPLAVHLADRSVHPRP